MSLATVSYYKSLVGSRNNESSHYWFSHLDTSDQHHHRQHSIPWIKFLSLFSFLIASTPLYKISKLCPLSCFISPLSFYCQATWPFLLVTLPQFCYSPQWTLRVELLVFLGEPVHPLFLCILTAGCTCHVSVCYAWITQSFSVLGSTLTVPVLRVPQVCIKEKQTLVMG